MQTLRFLFLSILLISCAAGFAKDKADPEFKLGVDYVELDPAMPISDTSTKQVNVQEFFSYACPACYFVEPTVVEWKAAQKDKVSYHKVPVVFRKSWEPLARAYYTALALDIEDKITPALFEAIIKQEQNLSTTASMRKFFSQHGVNSKDFELAYEDSPTISAQVRQSVNTMERYKIFSTPTFIVAGKYKTDIQMAKADRKRLMAILDFLVEKANN